MAFPRMIQEALERIGTGALSGALTIEHECEGAKFHSPSPLVVREVTVGDDVVWLCGTCADNLGVMTHLLTGHDGQLPWAVRREFGNRLRAIGERPMKGDNGG